MYKYTLQLWMMSGRLSIHWTEINDTQSTFALLCIHCVCQCAPMTIARTSIVITLAVIPIQSQKKKDVLLKVILCYTKCSICCEPKWPYWGAEVVAECGYLGRQRVNYTELTQTHRLYGGSECRAALLNVTFTAWLWSRSILQSLGRQWCPVQGVCPAWPIWSLDLGCGAAGWLDDENITTMQQLSAGLRAQSNTRAAAKR